MMTLSIRKLALASALPLALVLSAPAMAADATIDEVYTTAKAGQIDKALEMMQPVLKDHPNAPRAHYVEAELLAKAGRLDEARTELAKAEQLKPGLPFAKAGAVAELKQQLSAGERAARSSLTARRLRRASITASLGSGDRGAGSGLSGGGLPAPPQRGAAELLRAPARQPLWRPAGLWRSGLWRWSPGRPVARRLSGRRLSAAALIRPSSRAAWAAAS
jgi:tetratricopeptide (TPR) repeat protein